MNQPFVIFASNFKAATAAVIRSRIDAEIFSEVAVVKVIPMLVENVFETVDIAFSRIQKGQKRVRH